MAPVSVTQSIMERIIASSGAMQDISAILRLVYHRNENQHRHSIWWKWVKLFNKSVRKILESIQPLAPTRLEAEVTYVRSHLLSPCHR